MRPSFYTFFLFCSAITVSGEVLFADECRKPGDMWSCSDCDRCLSIDECTDEDALHKAGYYCQEWPFFNRVNPPRRYQDNTHAWALFLPLEEKQVTCEAHNQTTCLQWEERKESAKELAVTTCVCEDYVYEGNSDYCQDWGCSGIGLKKCPVHDYDCGTSITVGSITYTTHCCGTRSCGDNCNTVVQYPKRLRDEVQNCTCIRPTIVEHVGDTTTTFCEKWECTDSANSPGYSYLEYETHTCTLRNTDIGYCEKWDWQTDDYDSFENTGCTCVETMTSSGTGTACKQFDCTEKGAEKVSPNLLWALWTLSILFYPFTGMVTLLVIGLLALVLSCGFINFADKNNQYYKDFFCGGPMPTENKPAPIYNFTLLVYSTIPFLLIPLLFGGLGAVILGPLPVLVLACFISVMKKNAQVRPTG
eukprot:CAMPEP_0114468730 /NCGR_PEP_ID=MMETSP0104-20121206/10337_1 /TAXON_ID=37642 ORGANISM="Paraphysomonas imperforata, Strain PA2" /NCGR_SAMPLE_ID=MMETSP0104 /ASSEMBLY_ACC=CAM_ASM_000202 /LENGTH=417 /DNA_ID=CAMNT_0001642333 /DNA_START=93 /DNA_END=1346 /DNA_ORIENTATION=+